MKMHLSKLPLSVFALAFIITSCISNPGDPIESRITYEVIVYDNPTDLNPMENVDVNIGSQKTIPGQGVEGTVQVTVATNSLGRAKITSSYELFENEQVEFVALLPDCNQSHCTATEIFSYAQASLLGGGSSFVAYTIPDGNEPDAIYVNP